VAANRTVAEGLWPESNDGPEPGKGKTLAPSFLLENGENIKNIKSSQVDKKDRWLKL
jgi:hypothetical protein